MAEQCRTRSESAVYDGVCGRPARMAGDSGVGTEAQEIEHLISVVRPDEAPRRGGESVQLPARVAGKFVPAREASSHSLRSRPTESEASHTLHSSREVNSGYSFSDGTRPLAVTPVLPEGEGVGGPEQRQLEPARGLATAHRFDAR